jgi:predicted ATPase/DNA-binding CsgD family transcriptional regulator
VDIQDHPDFAARAKRSGFTLIVSDAILPSSTGLRVLKRPERGEFRAAAPPVPTTPLFGRATALADLHALLAQNRTRLLTLTGAGGTGKSRLALELAHAISAAYTHTWFVDLTTIGDPGLVPGAIAEVVGAHETGIRPVQALLREVLSAEPGLIILDNFEHVLDAAGFIDDLVGACPNLVVLVTSREALGLRSEHVYLVEPLPVPDPGQSADGQLTRRVASVMLFEERARARRATFQLTDQALPAVAEICARLDGLPLAIELAAAQVGVLAPSVILARLAAGATLLGAVHRDLPVRHQTVQATVAWSYNLLEPVEQAVFRRCGVFSGGFTAAAAERVCRNPGSGLLESDTLEVLAQLVAKSLIRIADDTSTQPRFWLLETIRDYAIDQLKLADELAQAREAHTTYFVELVEQAQTSLYGPGMASALDDLALDYGNFRAVSQWALETGGLTSGLRLAVGLYRFWVARGHLTEARGWLEVALPRSQSVPPATRAAALNVAGVLAGIQHDHERATAFFRESLKLWGTLDDTGRQAGVYLNLGLIAHVTGDVEEAQRQFERADELFQAVGDRSGQARALGSRARLAREQADLTRALRLAEDSLRLFQATGDLFGTAHALANLGHIRLELDEPQAAAGAFREALETWRGLGNILDVAECLEGVAAVVADAQPQRAAHLLGSAEQMRKTSGAPVAAVDVPRYAQLVSRVKNHLGQDAFTADWAAGRDLPIDSAMDLALHVDLTDGATTPRAPVDEASLLSPRQRHVAQLISTGSSNREIADALVLSIKTVETHIQHIFTKLRVKSRAEIAVWAARHDLL